MVQKPTVSTFRKMKQEGSPIVMLTAYDAPTAALAAENGIDLI
jgi:3-methyl-2-oxobutanoate hydroxymethyltransferase